MADTIQHTAMSEAPSAALIPILIVTIIVIYVLVTTRVPDCACIPMRDIRNMLKKEKGSLCS
eukprot:4164161-Karenia_brevis.AAC.1